MLTDLQKRKFAVEFLLFDHDKDGVVDRQDLQMMADNLAGQYGHADGSQEHERTRAVFDRIWEAFWAQGDADGDGRVGLSERLASMEEFTAISAEQARGFSEPVIGGLFDLLDADGDGAITADEYRRFLRANGIAGDLVEDAVSRVVSDGRLARQEYVDVMLDYYLTTDADAAANWAWGAR
jgi:Ca2+-binding EF-hand superfamily protein